jgi:hypothetical protein
MADALLCHYEIHNIAGGRRYIKTPRVGVSVVGSMTGAVVAVRGCYTSCYTGCYVYPISHSKSAMSYWLRSLYCC